MQAGKPTIVITGTGSSGTKYITKVLKLAGLKLGHERLYEHGIASWYVAVGPVGENGVHPPHKGTPFDDVPQPAVVLHQTRHPLKTISTVQRYSGPSWDYVCHYTPVIGREEPLVLRCMKYWFYWTGRARALAEWSYRVEDIDRVWEEFCARIRRPEIIPMKGRCLQVGSKENSKRHRYRALKWAELEAMDMDLTKNIRRLARSLGYGKKGLHD